MFNQLSESLQGALGRLTSGGKLTEKNIDEGLREVRKALLEADVSIAVVREFVERAFARVGREIVWQGEGVEETGVDRASGDLLVSVDPAYFRPTEVDLLLGDPSKARETLGWQHTTGFEQLVDEMVDADRELLQVERHARRAYGRED